jgi:tripartite-type tricarboxylate transporter receptor subunit TctC
MKRLLQSLLCGMLLAATPATAQDWPTRPIKMIVSTGPGTGTDAMARLLSDRVQRHLGQQIVIENMAGAAGMIGAQAAARAPADGYTLYYAPSSSMSSNLFFYKNVPYHPLRDFAPVALVGDRSAFAVAVHPDVPVKTLPELIALAKAQPGKLTYAVDMSSGYQVAFGQLLTKRADVDIVRVPYKSAPQMLQDASSGTTSMVLAALGAINSLINGGRLRLLAIASEKRFPGLEDVPTVAETLPGVRIEAWFTVMAPKDTPEPIVRRVNEAVDRALKEPDMPQRFKSLGLLTGSAGTPASTGEYIRAELERWGALAKELDIQPQ